MPVMREKLTTWDTSQQKSISFYGGYAYADFVMSDHDKLAIM